MGRVSVYHWHLFYSNKALNVCGKCAKRELGSKNKKDWERLHES
jgi:hypothetical protein